MPEESEHLEITADVLLASLQALSHLAELPSGGDPALLDQIRVAIAIVSPERMICALDKAAETPDWWKVNRLHFFCPEMTQHDIAGYLKVKKITVKHYIKNVEIPDSAYDALPPIPKY